MLAARIFEDAENRVVDLVLEMLDPHVDSSGDPFWSPLMPEIVAEAARSPEISEIVGAADRDIRLRMIKHLSQRSEMDGAEARIELVIALLQGLRIRHVIDPHADSAAVVALARDMVNALLRKPGRLPLPA
jgi:hypothetical protein